jgi:NADH-quinone oxidoreductase subunit F
MEYMLLRHRDIANLNQIDTFLKEDGFEGLKKALKMETVDVTNEVKAAGLRGRGGAGFPAGVKWSFMDNNNWPHYVVANADESEPGTFKDRELMESNPFQFLEGIAISSYAVGANAAYVYLRGEFWEVAHFLDEKIEEMEKAGFLGENIQGTDYSLKIYTHLGAGAYICGEETALLESMEGKRGQPRVRPPFPPSEGLYNKPTVVNNVETLSSVPYIIKNGSDGYRKFGTEKSPGTKIFSLSGNVNNPGNYELPLGTPFRTLIFDEQYGGGIPDGKSIKAIMPAGASSSMVVATDEALDTPMDYEHVQDVGGSLGSASVIVVDDSVGLDWLIAKTMDFFHHESCGKCTPCREGSYWMKKLTERIHSGEGTEKDVKLLKDVAYQMQGTTLCALGEFSTMAVVSSIERFPEDFKK